MASTARIVIFPDPLDRTGLWRYMARKCFQHVVHSKVIAPHRTYALRASIHYDAPSIASPGPIHDWKIIASTPYAKFVHEGTGPHIITSRTPGGRLRFYWPKAGKVIYPLYVKHPGTSPNRFLTEPARRVWPG